MGNRYFVILICAFFSTYMFSQVRVKSYIKKNGTYVQSHKRSNPDGNPYNNWSTKGNVNPYTGKAGTKNVVSKNGYSYYESNTSKVESVTNEAYVKELPKGSLRQKSEMLANSIEMVYFEKKGAEFDEIFSLKNNTGSDISGLSIRLIYYMEDGNPIDYRDITLSSNIPNNLSRKFTIKSFDREQEFVYKYSSDPLKAHYTSFTIRYIILDYK